MERSARSKFNTQIYEEACEWFIGFRSGEIDAAERREFDVWLRKSPENLRAYLEIVAIWDEGPTLDPANKWDTETLIAQVAEEPDNIVAHPRAADSPDARRVQHAYLGSQFPVRQGVQRYRRFAIAASILLAAVGIWFYSERNTYSTDIGEQRSLKLSDGSTVDLNSRTKIRVRYSEHERVVELVDGQALFQVAKSASRPFIVTSDDTRVRALGTQFDVNRKRAGTVITVLEGRVAVLPDTRQVVTTGPASPKQTEPTNDEAQPQSGYTTPATNSIYLSAGEQLEVGKSVPLRPKPSNPAVATAWKQRQLVFESATLADVAEEFNRYNERPLIIEDAELYTFHISGVFSSADPAALIRFLRTRPGVQVTETVAEVRVVKHNSH